MISNGRELIQRFFNALNLRQMEQCIQLLVILAAQARAEPAYLAWCDYLSGILANEHERDWAKAERIFYRLLQNDELEATLQGRVRLALGLAYEYQGRWSAAIVTYEQSLPIFARWQQPLEQVKVYNNIAIALRKGYTEGLFGADALSRAILHCHQALDLLHTTEHATEQFAWSKGMLFNTLGTLHLHLQQWGEAIACYEQDLAICRRLDDRFGMGLSLGNLGEVYHRRGHSFWPQATAAYQEALRLIREFGNLYEETAALTNLGWLAHDMGQLQQAWDYYTQAIAIIESLRAQVSSDEGRVGFFATVVATYARAVRLACALGQPTQAFDLTERARSRAFVELLAQQDVTPSQMLPAALLHQEQGLRSELQQLYATLAAPTTEIQQREQQLAEIQRRIRLLDPAYADLRTVQPLTHGEVQARIPLDTALVVYFSTDQQLLAFVFTQRELTVHPLPLTPQALPRLFAANGHLQRVLPDARGRLHEPWLLERLYALLITPLNERLQGKQRLCLVPHGALHYLPFHALTYRGRDSQPRTLLDDHAVIYAPSATVLLTYCQRSPALAATATLTVGYNGSDLQQAVAEASAIGRVTAGNVLLAEAATQANLIQAASTARWLHLSCHGRFHPHAPLTSHLLLADGPLYAGDILRQLRLRAELVTLSACETGRSQVLQGDELIGLVRAFIYAGAASVVVSLWPVDEISTRLLMEHFYGELLAGQSKAVALRNAQQMLRALSRQAVIERLAAYGEADPVGQVDRLRQLSGSDQLFAHPYFWAPFVLVGDRLNPLPASPSLGEEPLSAEG